MPEREYDSRQQLWLDRRTGTPLVLSDMPENASSYGETSLKKVQEGADQVNFVHASTYGETALTRSHEGTDQSETTVLLAPITEDADNPEIVIMKKLNINAPYSHF